MVLHHMFIIIDERKKKHLMLRKMMTPIIFTKNVIKEGTRVRIARKKESVFEKSSLRNWTNEIFKINKVLLPIQ